MYLQRPGLHSKPPALPAGICWTEGGIKAACLTCCHRAVCPQGPDLLVDLDIVEGKGGEISQMLREALRSPVFGHLFPGLCFHSPVVCNVIYYEQTDLNQVNKTLQATRQNTDENGPGVLL